MLREDLVERCQLIPKFKDDYLPHLSDQDLFLIIIEDYIYNKKVITKGKFSSLNSFH